MERAITITACADEGFGRATTAGADEGLGGAPGCRIKFLTRVLGAQSFTRWRLGGMAGELFLAE